MKDNIDTHNTMIEYLFEYSISLICFEDNSIEIFLFCQGVFHCQRMLITLSGLLW